MPIYEYRCSACEHELETLRKMSDPPLTHCPACDTENLVKRVSAAAFRLKGSGWYETDFKKDGRKNLAGDGDKTSATSSASSSASTSPTASTSSAGKATEAPAAPKPKAATKSDSST